MTYSSLNLIEMMRWGCSCHIFNFLQLSHLEPLGDFDGTYNASHLARKLLLCSHFWHLLLLKSFGAC